MHCPVARSIRSCPGYARYTCSNDNNIGPGSIVQVRGPVDTDIRAPRCKGVTEILGNTFQKRFPAFPPIEKDLVHVRNGRDRMGSEHADIARCADNGHFCHGNRKNGDVFSVDCTFLRSPRHSSSAPLPHGRRMSAVSLLPSGPEPVPAATDRHSLRNFDFWPSTSWDEVSQSERTGSRRPLQPQSNFAPRVPTVSGYK